MFNEALWLLDGLLIITLLVLAVGVLYGRDLRQSVILFITFGLVVALIWARLKAPDVALAEAAIGAGLSGALLLSALRDRSTDDDPDRSSPRPVWQQLSVGLLVSGLALVVALALLEAHQLDSAGLIEPVFAALNDSGVSNPVTAVLLNYRAYDTLLELAVLLAAVLGVLMAGPARPALPAASPIVAYLGSLLVPLLVLSAGYLLWVGAHAPGGAFQAGSLLAAAGVVMHLSGRPVFGLPQGSALRLLLISGIAAFTLVGLMTLLDHGILLQYPEAWAGQLILFIELFATLAIAATLVLCYLGGRPTGWSSEQELRRD